MAAPNIVNTSVITGKTSVLAVTTSNQTLVSNSASSNKVFRLTALYIAQIEGTTATDVTVNLVRGATTAPLLFQVTVPAKATLDIINKPIWLEEGDLIQVSATVNNRLYATCSYEEIS